MSEKELPDICYLFEPRSVAVIKTSIRQNRYKITENIIQEGTR